MNIKQIGRIGLILLAFLGVGVRQAWSKSCAAQNPKLPDGSISVRSFGAVGNGIVDDTAAILCAIDALRASDTGRIQPGVVLFPAGTYLVSATLPIQYASGVTLLGTGQLATSLLPTSSLGGAPVIKLVNCVNCAILNLWIKGNKSSPPSAGIESQVNVRDISTALYPTNLLVRDVYIGDPTFGVTDVGLSYGHWCPANGISAGRK